MTSDRTLIVGLGSPHGDDQAGWLVADALSGRRLQPAVAVRKAMSPADVLDWVDGLERLIICDACRGLSQIGALSRWDWPADQLAQVSWSGTHDLALPAALELADRLGRLPSQTVIWAVAGATANALTTPSDAVAAAIPMLTAAITAELARGSACTNDRS